MKTFFCISTYHKGGLFLEALKEKGNRVIFLTSSTLSNADWPFDCIDRFCTVAEIETNKFDPLEVERTFAAIHREEKIDAIIALDDYDIEKAAYLREQFRIPGMTYTLARLFRDKLAMRVKADEVSIPQPRFTSVFNNEQVNRFANEIPAPWILKPRSEASASGIEKIENIDHLWYCLHRLGDERHLFLLEEYLPGDVLHVDAICYDGEVVYQRVSRYLDPPFSVVKDGGVFQSVTTPPQSSENIALQLINTKLLKSFGLQNCASHTEYIKDHKTGTFRFLETSARVGGAHLSEMLEAASGFNIWREWAYLEDAKIHDRPYEIPQDAGHHGGILMSVYPHERPDYSHFTDPAIWWKEEAMPYHIGMILKDESHEVILEKIANHKNTIQALQGQH